MENHVLRNISCSHCSKKFIFKDIVTGLHKQYGRWPHPMLLECGHSICKFCVSMAVTKATSFECNICKHVTPSGNHIPDWKDFPLNFYLVGANLTGTTNMSFRDSNVAFGSTGFKMQKQKPGELNQPMGKLEICVECSAKSSKFSCHECKAFYCCPCFKKVHSAAKTLRKHVKVPLKDLEDTADKWVPPQVALCIQHPEQKLEFYCNMCEEVLCSYCVITQHQGHPIVTLLTKNKDSLTRLEEVQMKALEVMKRLGNSQKEVQGKLHAPQHKKQMKDVEQQVLEYFVYLHGVLQRVEHEVLEQLGEMQVRRTQFLESKSAELAAAINQLQMLQQEAQLAFNYSSMSGINISDITERLQFATQNLPCILLPLPKEDEDALGFVADETLVDHIKTHFELNLPPEEMFNILALGDLPEDVVLDPVDIQDMSASTLTSNSRASSVSCLSDTSVISVTPAQWKLSRAIMLPNQVENDKNTIPKGRSAVVVVAHINDPTDFYVNREFDMHNLQSLSRELQSCTASLMQQLTIVSKGDLCLVQYSVDKNWYRARVKEVIGSSSQTTSGSDQVEILYIDYGNTEIVDTNKLRRLPVKFTQTPSMALHCSLFGMVPAQGTWTIDAVQAFYKMINNERLKMVVMDYVLDIYKVDLCQLDISTNVPISVRDALVFFELAHFAKDVQPIQQPEVQNQSYFTYNTFKEGEILDVLVSHINTPLDLHVHQLGDHAMTLSTLMEEMNQEYNSDMSKCIIYRPQIGMVCAALYSLDKRWYRAKVVALPGNKLVEVLYVDYGNSEVIMWDTLRRLQDKYLQMSAQAIHCALMDIVPSENKVWSSESKVFLGQITFNKPFRILIDEIKQDKLWVTLYEPLSNKDLCVNAMLVTGGFAKSVGDRSTLVEYKKMDHEGLYPSHKVSRNRRSRRWSIPSLPSDDEEEEDFEPGGLECIPKVDPYRLHVKVLGMQSPSLIYILLTSQLGEINKLMDSMQKYYIAKNCKASVCEVGKICAVLEPKEKMWYRCILQEMLPDEKVKVFLVDLATEVVVLKDDLRSLDLQYVDVPFGARKCHLAGIQAAGDKGQWPILAIEHLKELLHKYEPSIFITKIGEDELEDEDLSVELWVKDVVFTGPLDPVQEEWHTLNKKLIEQGTAIPIKGWVETPLPNCKGRGKSSAAEFGILQDKEKEGQQDSKECIEAILFDDEKPNLELSDWLPVEPLTKTSFKGVATFVDNKGYIFLQDYYHSCDILNEIQTNLLVRFANSKAEPQDLYWFPGQICIAQYHDDQNWYRGKVIKVLEDNTLNVLFMDYGNEESCKASELRKSLYMGHIPIQCYKCQLDRVKPIDKEWTTAALDFIHGTIVTKHCKVSVAFNNEQDIRVSIKVPGIGDLAALLVKEKHADWTRYALNASHSMEDDESSVIVEGLEEESDALCEVGEGGSVKTLVGSELDSLLDSGDEGKDPDNVCKVEDSLKETEESFEDRVMMTGSNNVSREMITRIEPGLSWVEMDEAERMMSGEKCSPSMESEKTKLKEGSLLAQSNSGEGEVFSTLQEKQQREVSSDRSRVALVDDPPKSEKTSTIVNVKEDLLCETSLQETVINESDSDSLNTVLDHKEQNSEAASNSGKHLHNNVCGVDRSKLNMPSTDAVKNSHLDNESDSPSLLRYDQVPEVGSEAKNQTLEEICSASMSGNVVPKCASVSGTSLKVDEKQIEEDTGHISKDKKVMGQKRLNKGRRNVKEPPFNFPDLPVKDGKLLPSCVQFTEFKLPNLSRFTVMVTAIFSPTHMFIHPCKVENGILQKIRMQFEQLSKKIQIEAPSQPMFIEYAIGQACCARYSKDDAWYRAIILDVNAEEIEVKYVDYGDREFRPRDMLRQLKPEWCKLPIQGMDVKLWNVEQVEGAVYDADFYMVLQKCLAPMAVAVIKVRKPEVEVEFLAQDNSRNLAYRQLVEGGLLRIKPTAGP